MKALLTISTMIEVLVSSHVGSTNDDSAGLCTRVGWVTVKTTGISTKQYTKLNQGTT